LLYAWKSIRGAGRGGSKGAVERIWESSAALRRSSLGRSHGVLIDSQRRVPKVKIEDIDHSNQVTKEDFNSAVAEARERGASRAAEILARSDMLSADAFARFIVELSLKVI